MGKTDSLISNEKRLNTLKSMLLLMKQKGVALITVLLVVALATTLAVTMMTRQQLDIRRTTHLLNGEQAYLYALGAESWAKQILWRDEKNVDHLKELWANQLPPLPILGGHLQGKIEDLQSRFNLNNLVSLAGEQDQDQVLKARVLFERLLAILELPPSIAQRVMDWIDPDTLPQVPEGAEDNVYLTKTPAYRTSNTLLSSPSELFLLIDKENYQKLLPYVCTVPTRTSVNVNTASAIMLRALVDGLSSQGAEVLTHDRDQKPFNTVQDFLVHSALAGLKVEVDNLSVSSKYFGFSVQVNIDKTKIYLDSLLHRLPQQIVVIMRSQGQEL